MDESFQEMEGDGFEEKHRKMADQIEAAGKTIGLYMDMIRVMPMDPANPTRLIVQTNFVIGDLAYSSKIQNPEQHKFDEGFKEIASDASDDIIEDLRKKAEAGELPWQKKDEE